MHTLTAVQIKNKFLNHELSALEIVDHFLNRIDRYDGQIGAFLTVYHQKAREKAKRLDEKLAKGEDLGKLAGIPIAIKDNIHVKNEICTCASQFLTHFIAPFDATAVKLINAEDAIIIGKTNLDEFAMGSSTENSSMKTTRNPWNLECAPGGSSGGSAAAVAARFAPLALGSDTGGSIRQPASFCGVVGFKPTYGRVSRYGLVAFGSSLDQIGPIATCTEDAALLMEVIGAHCPRDSTSIPLERENYLAQFKEQLAGVRVGVPFQFLQDLKGEAKDAFNLAIETMKKQGASICEVDLSTLKYAIAVYYILATAEASTNLARFDGVRYGIRAPDAETLDQVYERSKEMGFGPEVKRRIMLGTFVLSTGYQDAYYKKAQKVRTLMIEQYRKAFENCDLIAMPTSAAGAFKIGSIKDPLAMYLEDIYTISVNLAGLPAVSIPNGFTPEKLPLGLQLIGPQKEDVRVLSLAHAFESASSNQIIPPVFKD